MAEPDMTLLRFLAFRKELAERREPLNGDGGGGTSGGMEARIARLESDMEHVKKAVDRLHDLPRDLAVLDEKVKHLPSKSWLVTVVVIAVTFLTTIIAFSEKIHTLLK